MAKGSLEEPASESEYRKRIGRSRLAVVAILGLSLLIFFIIAYLAVLNEGYATFIGTLLSLNPFYFSLALACTFLGSLIGFPKWEMFVNKLRVRIDSSKNLAIYLSMFSMDITPGRWGRAVVSYTMNRLTGVRFGKTFPAVVADILTDFLGFIVVAFAAALLVKSHPYVSLLICCLLLIPFFFIYVRQPFEYVKGKLWRFIRLRGIFKTADMYFESSKAIDFGSYVYAMVFTIPSVLLSGTALYFVMLSFGVNVPPSLLPTVLFVYTSSFLIGMLTAIPGALGVTDAVLLGYLTTLFPELGIGFGLASAITIAFRVASLWFMEGLSTIFLVYTMRYWRMRED